ncbi:MAG TPA: hypothetical protein VFM72_01420, partial [Aequorivita sp.]|nr:hypothetical protein [Aequorivita sp.]
MRLFYKYILVAFCLTGFFMQAQNPSNMKELAQKYSYYFALNREAVFLHLNKTAVVPGENIWFAAYVYNPNIQTPSISTTNLHVDLYNEEGRLEEAKTIFIQNGIGRGFFKVDSLPSGKYMLKASTKYMENFREDLSFSQSFRILGKTDDAAIPIEYDLQLLPEGGHLVTDVMNTVGVKLIDNSGKGVSFADGKLLNSKNEVINTFKGNRFGLSKFGFVPVPGEDYHVVLTPINGNQLSQKMPESDLMGISMSANMLQPDKIILSFKTNRRTFENLQGKTFYMALHKEGIMKIIGFVIPEESLEATIPIPKKSLAPGINTITIFNEKFQPILERMVFNRNEIKRKSVTAKFLRTKRDSLVFALNSKDSLNFHSMSISVLPAGTKAYNPNNNILSALYIEPYIQGKLENGHYYFSNEIDRRRRDYDLDLLLLTQGWSKYSWQNVFNNTPKELFKAEQGFTISGGLNGVKDAHEKKVLLIADETSLFEFVDLKSDASFKLENIFLIDSASISVGLVNNKNQKLSKPPMHISVLPTKNKESIVLSKTFSREIQEPKAKKTLDQNSVPQNFLSNGIALGSVTVNAELQDEIDKEREEEKFRGHMHFDKYNADRMAGSMLLASFLRMHGFRVIHGRGVHPGLTITNLRASSFGGSPSPLLIIDDVKQMDYDRIEYMTMSDIENV